MTGCIDDSKSINKDSLYFYQIGGSDYPKIIEATDLGYNYYVLDSTYFPSFKVEYFSDMYLKDSLKLNQESLGSLNRYLYTKAYDINDSIPETLNDFDRDNTMDIFIPDSNDKSQIPFFIEFKSTGWKKQIFILHETLVLNRDNNSNRIIESYSIMLDTIKVNKRK